MTYKGQSGIFFKLRTWLCAACLLFAVAATGCREKQGEPADVRVLARYGNEKLSRERLESLFPDLKSAEDSALLTRQLVDQWLRDMAVAENARKTLGDPGDIEAALKDYERKLLIYHYHNQLIENELDTLIREVEVRAYYQRHIEKFKASGNWYSWFYISKAGEGLVKEAASLRDNDPAAIRALQNWCASQRAAQCKLDSTYLPEGELERLATGSYYNLTRLNKGQVGSYQTFDKGETIHHVVKMLDKVSDAEPMPLNMCRSRIREMILLQRKSALIERKENEILQKARNSGKVFVSTP